MKQRKLIKTVNALKWLKGVRSRPQTTLDYQLVKRRFSFTVLQMALKLVYFAFPLPHPETGPKQPYTAPHS